eukprot:jgi/Bigna1/75067/fgenesh1_pg.32_\
MPRKKQQQQQAATNKGADRIQNFEISMMEIGHHAPVETARYSLVFFLNSPGFPPATRVPQMHPGFAQIRLMTQQKSPETLRNCFTIQNCAYLGLNFGDKHRMNGGRLLDGVLIAASLVLISISAWKLYAKGKPFSELKTQKRFFWSGNHLCEHWWDPHLPRNSTRPISSSMASCADCNFLLIGTAHFSNRLKTNKRSDVKILVLTQARYGIFHHAQGLPWSYHATFKGFIVYNILGSVISSISVLATNREKYLSIEYATSAALTPVITAYFVWQNMHLLRKLRDHVTDLRDVMNAESQRLEEKKTTVSSVEMHRFGNSINKDKLVPPSRFLGAMTPTSSNTRIAIGGKQSPRPTSPTTPRSFAASISVTNSTERSGEQQGIKNFKGRGDDRIPDSTTQSKLPTNNKIANLENLITKVKFSLAAFPIIAFIITILGIMVAYETAKSDRRFSELIDESFSEPPQIATEAGRVLSLYAVAHMLYHFGGPWKCDCWRDDETNDQTHDG